MRHHSERLKFQDTWQFQEAKAKLSQVMDEVQKKGMQTIIRHGDEVFVVLSKEKYDEVTHSKNTLIDLFKRAPCQDVELDLSRSQETLREMDL